MIRVILLWALVVPLCAASLARAESAETPATIGVGAHGYDWLIGAWTCTNSMPSAMSGPATTTLKASRPSQGAIQFHATGTDYDASGYIAYDEKTKTWYNPVSLGSGAAGLETSKQTGAKTVWTGMFMDPSSGKHMSVRDTYTLSAMNKFIDLTEMNDGGTWKTISKTTCSKT
jgi:hypothetical protein